jgi:hypothetical protein
LIDINDLINRATGGSSGNPDQWFWSKTPSIAGAGLTTVAQRLTTLWQYDGIPSGGALPPTTHVAPTNATAGSLQQPTTTGTNEKLCMYVAGVASAAGTLVIYDRLLHGSGLSAISTALQTVGGSITRYTGTEARGNEIWIEINTLIGATQHILTVNYTDQAGVASVTTSAFGGTGLREAQRIIRMPLAAGDSGARAVASAQLDVSTGVQGDFGVVIARPLAQLPIPVAGAASQISFLDKPLKIKSDACLALAFLANGTTAPFVTVDGFFVEAAP